MLALTLTAALGGFLFGYDTAIIGGANLYIYDDLGQNSFIVKELVVSIALAGAVAGSLA